ncbi:diaminopimelate epimerase [Helicobacter brantae]|uniref:diaminopimelate epimerase n=1 Tax=Helicobacter brantae TaxID=375927 RepID=UPI001FECFB4F|nr:diaminopimelate epimerase [Helicobacter brantae]
MIELEKYSASGNDFLITHTLPSSLNPQELALKLCDRHNGIGSDGLVLLKSHSQYAYEWEFYNSDGSKARMCGNASRCVGLYAFLHSIAPKSHRFLSGAGVIEVAITSESYPYRVSSNLGAYKIFALNQNDGWDFFDTGVPHLVKFIEEEEEFENFCIHTMRDLRVQYDSNVNIVFPTQEGYKVKTFERGVEDITLACGTGMASVVASLYERGEVKNHQVKLIPPSGECLTFEIHNQEISFEGEVKKIAKCSVNESEI